MSGTTAADQAARRARVQAQAQAQQQPQDSTHQPSRRRRIAVWSALVVALLVLASIGLAVQSTLTKPDTGVLDPQGVGASGAQALARVLEAQGTEIVVVRDRAAAERALAERDATLVLADTSYLSDESVLEVVGSASAAVLLQVPSRLPELLVSGASAAGYHRGDALSPRCDAQGVGGAGAITPGRMIELSTEALRDGAEGCYPDAGAFGLVQATSVVGTPVTLIDAVSLFSNAHIVDESNAALALGLLGAADTLVWFVPGLAGADVGAESLTLGELTPGWVSPAIVLLLCAGLAAAVWRGRRFGPLVAERLPVTVRASETTEGRARLYARSRDAVHAADQLRIGTLERCARMLGLGPSAAAPDISDAMAARIGADSGVVRGILIEQLPSSDAQLVALSDQLRDLETAVRSATRPERIQP